MMDVNQAWRRDVENMPKGGLGEAKLVPGRGGSTRAVQKWEAPRVITASKCGKVIATRWLDESQRWEFYNAGDLPVAWMPYPSHPGMMAEE